MEHHESNPSQPSPDPTTTLLDAISRLLATLRRQHSITIVRLAKLEERLPVVPEDLDRDSVRSIWANMWPFTLLEDREHRDAG